MKIDMAKMGSVTVLSPVGAISQMEADEFTACAEEHRKRCNGRLVLDFSQVSFVDSKGIEALWDLADRQRESGHTARVAAVPELCREIFELTGFSEHLDLFDSAESAVRSFL